MRLETQGSRYLLRKAVNKQPELLRSALRESDAIGPRENIAWQSPLVDDARGKYREYKDGAAIRLLGLDKRIRAPLADFWPSRGPLLQRLRRRDAESLAAFILSLAQVSGPVGEQVRTLIVGDDVKETVGSLRERIRDFRTPTESENRRQLGREIGERLELILEAIETMVLPVDPKKAFALLVSVFEADAVAMENCGDHEFEAASAFERAAELIGRAGKSMPQAEVVAALEALLEDDGYGVRDHLAEVIESRGEDR